jgi:hypothetical protein
MKTIQWKVVMTDDNRIASVENAIGFDSSKVESHLLIMGILDNLKAKHQEKIKSLFEKTFEHGKKDSYDL